MEELIIPLILSIGIILIIKLFLKLTNKKIPLNEKNLFLILLSSILIGYITDLDNTDRWGCIITFNPFSFQSIAGAILSFGLIYWAYKSSNRRLKKYICLTETFFWISKLIIFKGGYVSGFGGTPDFLVVTYDLMSIAIRIALIFILFEIINLRFIKLVTISLVLIFIKINTFSTPLWMVYEENKNLKYVQQKIENLKGEWNGEVIYKNIIEVKIDSLLIDGQMISYSAIEYDTIITKSKETVKIDKNYFYFSNHTKLNEKWKLFLYSPTYGDLNTESNDKGFQIIFNKTKSDSLNFELENYSEFFYFSLTRKN